MNCNSIYCNEKYNIRARELSKKTIGFCKNF
jgi:hypothetical protein